jgi:hypothetical protein
MKKALLTTTAIALFGIARVFADSTFTLKVTPGVYDPGKTKIVSAKWVDKEGLADNDMDLNSGKPGKALVLTKNGPTATNAASGASIQGVAWVGFKEVGFDLRNDGHQGAGAPRFNLITADGVLHFCGAAGAHSKQMFTDALGRAWTRFRFDGTDCFPPIAQDAIIVYLDITFDEGTDSGPGITYMDNIDVNGTLVLKD